MGSFSGKNRVVVSALQPKVRCGYQASGRHANISTSSRYLKPSKLALHTTIQRIDAQRRANGEAAKWEQELAEMKKNLRDVPQKCHKLIESGEKRDVEKPATAR